MTNVLNYEGDANLKTGNNKKPNPTLKYDYTALHRLPVTNT